VSLVTGGIVRYGTSEEKAAETVFIQFSDSVGESPLGGLDNAQRSQIVKAALDAVIANLPTGGTFPGYYAYTAGDEVTVTKTQVSPTA
jgi:hypothetical protein